MKISKPRYKKLLIGKHTLLALALVLLLSVVATVYPGSNYIGAATNPPGIKRCEHKDIKNTQKCKNQYRGCVFTSGGGLTGGQSIAECRDGVIAAFKKSGGGGGGGGGDAGGGGNGGPSTNEPSIQRCERDDIQNAKQCKKAFRKCNKDHRGEKNKRIQCKTKAINDHKKSDPGGGDEPKKDPPEIGDAGKYTCGTFEDEERNVKTRFNFGCIGTEFAETGQGKSGVSPILDLTFAFVRFMSVGVGIVLAASMIMSGIQYSMSEGNAEVTQKAKARIRSASMGFIIYLFAYAILQFLIPGGAFSTFWLNETIIQSIMRLGL